MFNSRSQTRNEQFLTNNYWYFWLVWDIFIDVRFSSLLVPIGWSCQLTNMFTWVDITNQICFNVTQCSQFQWFHCHKHGAITNLTCLQILQSRHTVFLFVWYLLIFSNRYNLAGWEITCKQSCWWKMLYVFLTKKTETQMHCKSWYYKRITQLLIDARDLRPR